jgi:hypothetical protein
MIAFYTLRPSLRGYFNAYMHIYCRVSSDVWLDIAKVIALRNVVMRWTVADRCGTSTLDLETQSAGTP